MPSGYNYTASNNNYYAINNNNPTLLNISDVTGYAPNLYITSASDWSDNQVNVFKTMKVDTVARDSNGDMVAKLFKDGTFICSPKLQEFITKAGADNLSGVEKMRLIEKQLQ